VTDQIKTPQFKVKRPEDKKSNERVRELRTMRKALLNCFLVASKRMQMTSAHIPRCANIS